VLSAGEERDVEFMLRWKELSTKTYPLKTSDGDVFPDDFGVIKSGVFVKAVATAD
jgi:hypothetical protein